MYATTITGPLIVPDPSDTLWFMRIPISRPTEEKAMYMVLAVLHWIGKNTLWDGTAKAYYIPAQAIAMMSDVELRDAVANVLTKGKGLIPGACPTCKGKGTVPQEATMTSQGMQAMGTGHPIPCPTCKGKKGA